MNSLDCLPKVEVSSKQSLPTMLCHEEYSASGTFLPPMTPNVQGLLRLAPPFFSDLLNAR